MTKVWPSGLSRTQTTLAAHTSLRLNKALLMELKSSGVRGRGSRTKFSVKEITVWNMHKSVNKLCRSYQHRIFGASQLSSEAPPACQQPSASHARHTHSNTLGGSAMAKPASLGPRGGGISSLLWGYHPLSMYRASVHFSTHVRWPGGGPLSLKLNNTFVIIFEKSTQLGKVWYSHLGRTRMCSFSNVRRNQAKSLSKYVYTRRFYICRWNIGIFDKIMEKGSGRRLVEIPLSPVTDQQ